LTCAPCALVHNKKEAAAAYASRAVIPDLVFTTRVFIVINLTSAG